MMLLHWFPGGPSNHREWLFQISGRPVGQVNWRSARKMTVLQKTSEKLKIKCAPEKQEMQLAFTAPSLAGQSVGINSLDPHTQPFELG